MKRPGNADVALIQSAKKLAKTRPNGVAAALRTKSGKTFTAIQIESNLSRIGVCAEAIAIGMAATAGDTEIEAIVAVKQSGQVTAPCGMCRELIAHFAPDAVVIVPGRTGEVVTLVSTLLPICV